MIAVLTLGPARADSATDAAAALDDLDRWARHRLTRVNAAILAGRSRPETLVRELNHCRLATAPDPAGLPPRLARPLLTLLGLIGSSVALHAQQHDAVVLAEPARAFTGLAATADQMPFRDYVAAVAEKAEPGHPSKDSFTTLVTWNVPTTRLVWQGRELATRPGYFAGPVRTYTGDRGETSMLTLVKKAQTFEEPANDALLPIVRREIPLHGPEAIERVRFARAMLDGLRAVFLEYFVPTDDGQLPLTVKHFMDVFRQFSVHWDTGDVPTSASQDAEQIRRDYYLGIDFRGYDRHIARVLPALLPAERRLVDEAMQLPSIPELVLARLPRPATTVRSAADMHALAREHPHVVDYHLLLQAHARAGSAHLGLAKQFLFNPMRERDRHGLPDAVVVSHRVGTTGTPERLLDELTDGRRRHPLRFLARLPSRTLRTAAGVPAHQPSREQLLECVRIDS
ncbi:MAG: hypothetical protein M3235_15115 [Actinomycetota bacterium]|nr:hypothetical protein [Actinomycetota bacterium]